MNSLRFEEHPLNKLAPIPVMTNVRELRQAADFSQETAAERFDISLRVWQMKETLKNPSSLSQGEYELLLLLAGQHPHYTLQPHPKK